MEAVLAPKLRLALSRRALRVADDARLVAEVRAGNRSAFEAVYDRHHAGILAFCRHMLGSREESEDVVQHTFASAYRSLLADNREIALKAWLYTIARNRCLSVLRARREEVALDDTDARIPATAGLSAEVEQREDLRALLADLQRLPDDQRAALILAELGAHSHEEIAHVLGVPAPKVKALVFQAREALMSRRHARDADCGAIREQLSVLRGGARRRGELRHHVAQCAGCRAFDAEVRRQRAGLAVLLPVVPALTLKESSLFAAFAAGGSGAAGVGGGGAAAGVSAAGATAVGGSAAAGGGVAGGAAAAGGGAAAAGGGAAVAGGGAAVAGGAAGLGGSTALMSSGAALGAKVFGAKALTALALSGAAGGGYVAVKEIPNDPPPAPTQAALVKRDLPQRQQGTRPPVGGVVVPTDEECRKQPAAASRACMEKVVARPTSAAGRLPGDRHRLPVREDIDRDGVANGDDACPTIAGQVGGCPQTTTAADPAAPAAKPGDRDADGIPNRQDGDRDGDGVPNEKDPCPNRFGMGNGCPLPAVADPAAPVGKPGDRDGDGIPNAEDDDRDGDGVPNAKDPCPNKFATGTGCPLPGAAAPTAPSKTPGDRDRDGIPNRQDDDRDGDGIPNADDACPNKRGIGTGCPAVDPVAPVGTPGDRDGDGIPNAEDDDRDGDLILNVDDACPNKWAPKSANGCPATEPAEPPTTTTPTTTTTTTTPTTTTTTPEPAPATP